MSQPTRSRFFVRQSDVKAYSPANHAGTTNRRLVGPETVGAKGVEVVLGIAEKGGGAYRHAHPGIEQVCYFLEGRARVEAGGEVAELGPGDVAYFPPDVPHIVTTISDEPVKVVVIYSPPYGESKAKGVAR
jgi:quercetin dioxygenase-like cupin family protein